MSGFPGQSGDMVKLCKCFYVRETKNLVIPVSFSLSSLRV